MIVMSVIAFAEIIVLAAIILMLVTKFHPPKESTKLIYVDSSVLIDGRILNIALAGFLDGKLVFLRSVLRELQVLADSKDREKRNRARAALNRLTELEEMPEVSTEVIDDGEDKNNVDEQLITFAKANNGSIMTLDYNLIMFAKAAKVSTLNINDLAMALRKEFLPGEKAKILITEKGSSDGQGVGHLTDGTMVVVEKAAKKIGKEVEIEFVRFRETSSGKMIFARMTHK